MLKRLAILLASVASLFQLTLLSQNAQAGDISWSGLYRIEYNQSENLELNSAHKKQGYFLHHLVLNPKIIAADGLTIYSRFDVFNNCQFGMYGQAGQFIGDGPNNSAICGTTNSGTNSNVFARSQNPESLLVNELYLTWAQEFGSFVAGRVPLQFGLGITYNAGKGAFDHWLTNEDLVGYKIVMGNLFFMPMIGRVSQANNTGTDSFDIEGGVNDYMFHLQYDNPETELSLGAFIQIRVATGFGDDTPVGSTGLGGSSAVRRDNFKTNTINIFSKQKHGDLSIGVEASLDSGKTGAMTSSTGGNVALNSYAIASEVAYAPKSSNWNHLLKLGVASGDDPGTNDSYEGAIYNRNYHLGMLLFRRPLGRGNFLRTQLIRDVTTTASNNIDNEAISNAIYLAPSTAYKVRDNLSLGATLVYGRLMVDPFVTSTGSYTGTSKDLGFETDFSINYKPYERFTWLTEVGVLIPGSAWQGGSLGYGNEIAYAISTKAAISF